jgi:flagellar biosynthesis GTPase FlhF
MISSGQNISRSRWLITALTVGFVICVGGYCTLFAQTNTEHNAEKAIKDLQIDTTIDEPNIPIPEIYETPPKIVPQMVGGKQEFKLFYFCKQHTSDELKKIVHEQFATMLFNEKGKSTQVTDYTVSSNPATNQLIVRCPLLEDAEAVKELLESVDVPPIQVKIDCLVSEIYADFTFDRETTIEIGELFGEDIAMRPGGLPFGSSVQDLIDEGGEIPPAFPGASLRELIRARMGLNIGYLSTARDITVLIDLLESRGFMKILMNPMIETTNGKTSIVKSTQQVPLQTVTKFIPIRSGGSDYAPQTEIEYVDVIDSLEITPHVFSDGSIALETNILLGARNTPDGVKQVPIITKREITSKENRIRSGESLIIGGIRKTLDFGVVRGVPILKDIPILGFLFSGEDTEQRTVETVFVLTPTYSTGGRPKQEIMKGIRKKHAPASPGALQEAITDFFGDKSSEERRQHDALEAERSRLEAEAENVQVRSAARESTARAERLTAEAQKATSDAAKTKADADELMAEAKKLMAEAEAKAKAAEKAKQEAEAEKAKIAEQKAKAEAETEKPKAKKDNTKPEA